MKKIPFDIKYRPEIESGKYKVIVDYDWPVEILSWDCLHERDGKAYPILAKLRCMNPGKEHDFIHWYDINGKYDAMDDAICTEITKGCVPYCPGHELYILTEEHPLITELKEHLASLSEEDKHKEWQELQEWYNEHFKPEHMDWVEDFRKDIEEMSQEAFDEKWTEIKKRCGEDNEEDKSKELTEFEYAVLSVISDHNNHTDSIEDFARRNAKNLLSIAYKQFEKERLTIPENNLSSIDFFFDNYYVERNPSKRECFRTGYACGRTSVESEQPKWKKNGNSIGGNGYDDIYLIRSSKGCYFTSSVLSPNVEYIELEELEKLPKA